MKNPKTVRLVVSATSPSQKARLHWRTFCPKQIFWMIRKVVHYFRNRQNAAKLLAFLEEDLDFQAKRERIMAELGKRQLCPKLEQFVLGFAKDGKWARTIIIPRTRSDVAVVLQSTATLAESGLELTLVILAYHTGETKQKKLQVAAEDRGVALAHHLHVGIEKVIVTGKEVTVKLSGPGKEKELLHSFDFAPTWRTRLKTVALFANREPATT